MLYVRFPLSLRNVEDLLHERGVDVSYESVRCTGGIDLVLSSQARSRSAGQGECSPVIGNGTSDSDQML
jgi:transposase-like protein